MPLAMNAYDWGGPSALEPTDIPSVPPGPGEVTIAVRAIGVNPADSKVLRGMFGRDPSSLPARPGSELAGVVTAVGSDVVGPAGAIAVGDEVIGYRVEHGYVSEITVPVASVLPKPASLDWPEAAGLLATGAPAWHLLEATEVTAGSTVVIHGASGSVGSLAVQLAVARGARVVGTASLANHEYVRGLGAEPIAYGDGLLDRLRDVLPDGADAALDTVGTDEALDTSVALVIDRSRIATIAGFRRGAELGIRMLGGGPGADPGSAIRAAARLPLIALAGEGELRVRVAHTFPLTDASEALALVETGHPGGKMILIP